MLLLSHLFTGANWRVSLINVVIAPAVVNALIASAIVHLMMQDAYAPVLSTPQAVIADFSIGGLMIIVITGVIAYATTLVAYRRGQLQALPARDAQPLLDHKGTATKRELILTLLGFAMLHMLLVVGTTEFRALHSLGGETFVVLKLAQALTLSLMSASLGAAIATRHFHMPGAERTA